MIFCKKCGYEGTYLGKICPVCHQEIEISEDDAQNLILEAEEAKKRKDNATMTENYHILADYGFTDGEREWAKILEKGNGADRNIDAAMEFYRRAAEKLDPYSAYRYSELVSRMNADAADFWLKFSALLGEKAAYIEAYKLYSATDQNKEANHYLYLAAMADDVDAIAMLAEKYYTGNGIEQSSAYAKWYMDKLTFPPFYAIKLAIKLRTATAIEAPNVSLNNKNPIYKDLLEKAKENKLVHPIFHITSLLFESGECEYGWELAEMYLQGIGTQKDVDAALRCLYRSAASGSGKAYILLAKLHYEGEFAERNVKLAIEYLGKACQLNSAEAFELLGDIYHDRDFEDRDVAKAEHLYSQAEKLGSQSAANKAQSIRKIRDDYYKKAMYAEDGSQQEAFKFYYIATVMGHPTARIHLARAYAIGLGTKRDPKMAFANYRLASSQGCEEAYFPLGICYSRGIGTAFNFDLAIENFTRAVRLGDERGNKEIRRLYENKKKRLGEKIYSTAMRLIYQGKFEAAIEYLLLALRFSHPKAVYTLGTLYEFGKGTAQNKDDAYNYYRIAKSLGFADDRSAYKLKILKMLK